MFPSEDWGGTGSVLVDGLNSKLDAGSSLAIGVTGEGTLNISNGGTASAIQVVLGCDLGASGNLDIEAVASSMSAALLISPSAVPAR